MAFRHNTKLKIKKVYEDTIFHVREKKKKNSFFNFGLIFKLVIISSPKRPCMLFHRQTDYPVQRTITRNFRNHCHLLSQWGTASAPPGGGGGGACDTLLTYWLTYLLVCARSSSPTSWRPECGRTGHPASAVLTLLRSSASPPPRLFKIDKKTDKVFQYWKN